MKKLSLSSLFLTAFLINNAITRDTRIPLIVDYGIIDTISPILLIANNRIIDTISPIPLIADQGIRLGSNSSIMILSDSNITNPTTGNNGLLRINSNGNVITHHSSI